MFKKIFTKRKITVTLSTIALLGLIGFAEKKTSDKEIKNIIVNVQDEWGNHFLDEGDIRRLITLNHTDSVQGKLYDEINLKDLEHRIKNNKFVHEVQVYKDYKGNVLVDVVQCRPIARMVQTDGPHAYIDETGKLLPVSSKYTARVMVIDGEGAGRLLDSTFRATQDYKDLVQMLQLIDADPFLKAQISQVTRRWDGQLQLRSQVGEEVIEFGKPDNLEVKFKKFKIYYKKIIQLKGFNKYKSVNLKFQDQIICE